MQSSSSALIKNIANFFTKHCTMLVLVSSYCDDVDFPRNFQKKIVIHIPVWVRADYATKILINVEIST